MKYLWIMVILGCSTLNVVGQIHGLDYWDHWQLGNQVSVNFPNGQAGVTHYDLGVPHRSVIQATICDPISGDILFSYDGDSIRGADNLVIAHGGLGPSFTDYARWIAHPGDGKIYYAFAKSIGGNVGWHYSVVHRDNGILTSESNVPLGPYNGSYYMEAISSPDGTTTWAVTHDLPGDAFRLYRIASPIGLDSVPTFQHIGPVTTNVPGGYPMRVSPDNAKLALIDLTTVNYSLWLFTVDPSSGALSDPRQIPFPHEIHGAEFSPNSRFLYLVGGLPFNQITQIDLAAGDSIAILASAVVLPMDTTRFKDLPRLGTDGRIYIGMQIAGYDDRYARILDPDQPGSACNTDTAGLVFPTYSYNPLVWNYWPFTPSYLGTTEYQAQANKLRAWPVPSRDDVSIDLGLAPDHASVRWIDAAGRTVRTQPWPAHTSVATFDRGSLPSGAYIIEVRPENSSPRRAKVMLE